MDLVVFGAQGIALGAYHAIRDISPLRRIRCFLVTELGKNEKVLEGLPVLELRAFVSGLSADRSPDRDTRGCHARDRGELG